MFATMLLSAVLTQTPIETQLAAINRKLDALDARLAKIELILSPRTPLTDSTNSTTVSAYTYTYSQPVMYSEETVCVGGQCYRMKRKR